MRLAIPMSRIHVAKYLRKDQTSEGNHINHTLIVLHEGNTSSFVYGVERRRMREIDRRVIAPLGDKQSGYRQCGCPVHEPHSPSSGFDISGCCIASSVHCGWFTHNGQQIVAVHLNSGNSDGFYFLFGCLLLLVLLLILIGKASGSASPASSSSVGKDQR